MFLVDVACRFVDAKVWLVQHVALLNSFKFRRFRRLRSAPVSDIGS